MIPRNPSRRVWVDFRVLRGLGMAGAAGRASASTGKLAVDEAMTAAGTVHTDKGVGTGS